MKAPLTPEQFDAIDRIVLLRVKQHSERMAWSDYSVTGQRIRERQPHERAALKAELTVDTPE